MEPTRFFEAHGTGTKVGDPIEADVIGTAFWHCRSLDDPLYIGAAKANIGHLEGCSGLAGIIKAILVLENGAIPPIAGFELLNHRIDADKLHLHVSLGRRYRKINALTLIVSEESNALAGFQTSSSLCKSSFLSTPRTTRLSFSRSTHSALVAQMP